MINAIRLTTIRAQSPSVFSNPLPYHIGRKSSEIRFRQVVTSAGQPDNTNKMDQTKKPADEAEHKAAFGDGYATRSDEEGFGGVYGGNKEDEEKIIHGKAPEYDTNQGSEVKEKEKARNQRQAA
ncbi:uncharacterized protein LOC107812420 isoform X2 [Nicotiana tabacum]|uniref:Uncharacterized protein LOC107812420 isoform X2 n=2 Tax=Nicotiana TaxID=4085 RepID=A0A1S4BVZ5_TOBAC|nr:PREDICTED: uncharacterized protein LOC104239242 isoform X2 [Nicotiana sylvestris]XP_016493003.1 PREDICTED: uncharacterized protein LOC107812420 isoform X2 [Nicotiana tabacum]